MRHLCLIFVFRFARRFGRLRNVLINDNIFVCTQYLDFNKIKKLKPCETNLAGLSFTRISKRFDGEYHHVARWGAGFLF